MFIRSITTYHHKHCLIPARLIKDLFCSNESLILIGGAQYCKRSQVLLLLTLK